MNLNDPRLFRQHAYIDGQWTHSSGREAEVTNPATGEALGHIPWLDAEQIERAVTAAERAFTRWRALRADERGDILMAWFDLVEANLDDLATLMTLEQGKPLAEARGEVTYGASFIRWFAEEGKRVYGTTIPSHIPDAALGTLAEPVGVCALITPWNFPLAMITRKAAAALAAGCPVIVKPAGETPFTALALAELAERAGFPAGVFNVVTGEAAEVSGILCADERIKALSFTGSTRVGRLLLEQCAKTVKRACMELGGNAPFIVGPDVDPKAAAEAAVAAKFQTSGQDCLAANRILVHASIHDDFIAHLSERVAALKVDDGLAENVDIGPLIHAQAVAKAAGLVDDALAGGAQKIVGDQSIAPGANFFMPTLLTGVTPDMRIWHEENFAPVAGVRAFDDEDELLAMANDTEYGLAAYVYTHDIRRIWKLLRGLNYGMVAVNSVKMTGPPIPFGGVKQSGLGREGGAAGIEEFLETKYYCIGGLPSASGS